MPIDWDWIALLLFVLLVVVTCGGVFLLRPLSTRLGELLEAMTRERRSSPELQSALGRLHHSLEEIESRLSALEERQDFTEELLRESGRKAVGRGESEGAAAGLGIRAGREAE